MKDRKNYETYPLSPLQEGMLFHSLAEVGSGVDVEQIICTLSEPLELESFKGAWSRVVKRHPTLRSRFEWEGVEGPLQLVEEKVVFSPVYFDWRDASSGEQNKRLDDFLKNERKRGFEMQKAPLMRLAIFRLDDSVYKFVWTFHHILLDGRAFPIVLEEVFLFYEAFRKGRDIDTEKPRPYRDYIEWLQHRDLRQEEEFWRNALSGFRALTPIPLGEYSGGRKRLGAEGAEELRLSVQLTSRLREFAERNNFALNTLVEGAWALLLHFYSGNEDIVYGTTRSCRKASIAGAESMVGLLINTLPMRVKIINSENVLKWLGELREKHKTIRKYMNTPLHEIQSWSDIRAGTPLFESLVVFENYLLDSYFRKKGGSWLNREFIYRGRTNYPLTLIGYADNKLLLRIEYDEARFDQDTIRRTLGQLQTLLNDMVTNPEKQIFQLSILTEKEKGQLLTEWNENRQDFEKGLCVQKLFEAQVARTPDADALAFRGERMSYKELNRRSNRLARRLRSLGVGSETLVGLCVERSFEMMIGILGILKAGGAYVPLDPVYPRDRIKFMLEDTKAPVIVTQESLLAYLPENNAETVCLENLFQDSEVYDDRDDQNPVTLANAENLIYVIYTSGSTGKPKGVLITHANVMRLFTATDSWFHFGKTDVWTLFHSYAFDFSVWEMWGALLYGGCLVIVPYEVSRSPEEFHTLLIREGITVLNQTPSAFQELIQVEETVQSEGNLRLRLVIFGGEALDLQSLKPWIKRHGDSKPQLVNMYGITETTVHVTYRPLTEQDVYQSRGSVIGIAIPDLEIYLLDQNLQPVPIGVPAELYVGGAGLGRGYLNRPELTDERFIPHPFKKLGKARLYKSGDLARYLPNGDFEYLGRGDQQVQVRGFRVELGEIEVVLGEVEDVRKTVVVLREDEPGDERIVAYFVTASSGQVSAAELRKHLRKKLPEYMIPQYFVELPSIPLTPNGKADRKALPPPPKHRQAQEAYKAPRNKTEKTVANIWEEILHLKKVGAYDSFFELGGHSLLAMRVVSRLRREMGVEIKFKEFFNHPTVRALASQIELQLSERQGEGASSTLEGGDVEVVEI